MLVISIHKYDNGTIFPGTGSPAQIGRSPGTGFNVNIGLNTNGKVINNDDYVYLFDNLVLPVMTEFNPELVYISAGFGSVQKFENVQNTNNSSTSIPTQHQAQPCKQQKNNPSIEVTPECYGWLTQTICDKFYKTLFVLEGGYDLEVLTSSILACTQAMTGIKRFVKPVIAMTPSIPAFDAFDNCTQILGLYWPSLLRCRKVQIEKIQQCLSRMQGQVSVAGSGHVSGQVSGQIRGQIRGQILEQIPGQIQAQTHNQAEIQNSLMQNAQTQIAQLQKIQLQNTQIQNNHIRNLQIQAQNTNNNSTQRTEPRLIQGGFSRMS